MLTRTNCTIAWQLIRFKKEGCASQNVVGGEVTATMLLQIDGRLLQYLCYPTLNKIKLKEEFNRLSSANG